MNIIETTDLQKHFGRVKAVDGVSFSVAEGQVFGFLGPNGCGKTTTIGMLLGIINPTGGGMRLFGGGSEEELHVARRRIGATLETPNFYPYMSGRDNLRLAAKLRGVAGERIDHVLDLVGLSRRGSDRFKTYSLGMKQRLALAATMLADPDLVILDEPANGLDPEGMREIREIILNLASQGKTIFLSSHLLDEVEKTCTHVAIVKKGKILRQSSVEELTQAGALAEVRGEDLEELCSAISEYPEAVSAAIDGDLVLAGLKGHDLAGLNQFLAARNIFASHLTLRHLSLEDVFIEVTRGDGSEPKGVA